MTKGDDVALKHSCENCITSKMPPNFDSNGVSMSLRYDYTSEGKKVEI